MTTPEVSKARAHADARRRLPSLVLPPSSLSVRPRRHHILGDILNRPSPLASFLYAQEHECRTLHHCLK